MDPRSTAWCQRSVWGRYHGHVRHNKGQESQRLCCDVIRNVCCNSASGCSIYVSVDESTALPSTPTRSCQGCQHEADQELMVVVDDLWRKVSALKNKNPVNQITFKPLGLQNESSKLPPIPMMRTLVTAISSVYRVPPSCSRKPRWAADGVVDGLCKVSTADKECHQNSRDLFSTL